MLRTDRPRSSNGQLSPATRTCKLSPPPRLALPTPILKVHSALRCTHIGASLYLALIYFSQHSL